MDMATGVQMLDTQMLDTPGKSINPVILLQATGK